jgi:hypothetical protein
MTKMIAINTQPLENMGTFYETFNEQVKKLSYFELGRTMVNSWYFVTQRTAHLKSVKLTTAQEEKAFEIWKKNRPDYQQDPVVVDFCKKVICLHHMSLSLKKMCKLNGIFDKNQFERLSKAIDEYSTEALTEVMFERTGIASLKCMARTYLQVNLKESWETERWWINLTYETAYADDGLKQITHDKRERFQKLYRDIVSDLKTVRANYPKATEQCKKYAKHPKYVNLAQQKCLENRHVAHKAMINMYVMRDAFTTMLS